MASVKRSIVKGLIIVVVGALIGTIVGDILAAVLPDGAAKNFFIKSFTFGLEPATFDARILVFTLGLVLKINVMTVVGIITAGIILYKL